MKSVYIKILPAALAACILALSTSCTESDVSNKRERNAIRRGNELYDSKEYKDAVTEYGAALDANPSSEAAIYDKAMASLNLLDSDSVTFTNAVRALDSLGNRAQNTVVAERSLYNLGNLHVIQGDMLKAAAQAPENQEHAQEFSGKSTEYYKRAIDYYKKLLRKHPNNLKALQNLRVAQLKLPPEQQGGGGGQNQQQKQQQQQQQKQEQQKQNPEYKQALQSIQNKENNTRKNQEIPVGVAGSSEKPW